MVTMVTASAPLNGDNSNAQGHCNRCGKIWTLTEGQGVCRWCGKLANCQTSTTKPRHTKSSSRRKPKQANGHNGYDQLQGEWLTYYKVALPFAKSIPPQDTFWFNGCSILIAPGTGQGSTQQPQNQHPSSYTTPGILISSSQTKTSIGHMW